MRIQLSIGGKTNANELHVDDWRKLAASVGMSAASTLARVRQLAETVDAHLATASALVEAMPAGGHDVIGKAVHAIRKRCRRLLDRAI